MTPRKRQPLAALMGLLLPVALICGIALGGHPGSLPGFLRNWLVGDRQTRVVNQALDDMTHDYYRPLSQSQLAGAAISGAVASLHDRFSHYLTPSQFADLDQPSQFSGIGVGVQPERTGLLILQVFDQSPASHAGLEMGDLIVAVGGHSIASLGTRATGQITGPPGTPVVITYLRGHTRKRVTITRETVSTPVVASEMRRWGKVLVGVVALASFSDGAGGEVRQAVQSELHRGAQALVLDLRENGGGLVDEARLTASIFIPKGVIVTTRGRSQPTTTLTATGGAISTHIPLVVLVDRNTASASEIVTGALQDDHRALVVGTHTFGKGVFQEVRPLSNGGALDITVGEYYTPNGRNLGGGGVAQGAGIVPDVPVASGVDGAHGLDVALKTVAAEVK
ncbi:MAG TPA: S41 family peptidase [Solirubrobacteraceae bacterium]|jgi:carboxyl-terminal processing protease|nr:S41 family peptidase [Solirubrobacteraceae bacterium]